MFNSQFNRGQPVPDEMVWLTLNLMFNPYVLVFPPTLIIHNLNKTQISKTGQK